jgi:hypothetical protein
MAKDSEYKGIKVGMESEEELAFRTLFPSANPFQLLQMITEIPVRNRINLSVVGVIRRLYSGTGNIDILKVFQEEFNINGIPLDRKGRLEASEIVAAVRAKREEGED